MADQSPASPGLAKYPPFAPYETEPMPPTVEGTILTGREIRVKHKPRHLKPAYPPPRAARPGGPMLKMPKGTEQHLSARAMKAHARCMRKHCIALTDRLERMSKPSRRHVLGMWREHYKSLPPETIARLRGMLNADEPFKPDQAYEYFTNLKRGAAKSKKSDRPCAQIKKDLMAMVGDRRFSWARNATVAFARGVQQRLSRPGKFTLADGMLRLSDIILHEICGYMNVRTPSRRSTHPKAKFMVEMADKIAVWIDEILSESEDRLLMMDFDEDDVIKRIDELGGAGFTDDFLDMMGGGPSARLKAPKPAYLKFKGPMAEAFKILTGEMYKRGSAPFIQYGKFEQNYKEGADELRAATDFRAVDYNLDLEKKVQADLTETAREATPPEIVEPMKEIVDICSKYLAQYAEYSKEKGKAFRHLIKKMNSKPDVTAYVKGKTRKSMSDAAKDLIKAKGFETDHEDPNLSQTIHGNLSKVVTPVPSDLKTDMSGTLDLASKWLSQNAVDESERGPAFDLLLDQLRKHGGDPFTPAYRGLTTNYSAAHAIESAPGLSSIKPDPGTVPEFNQALHRVVDVVTPSNLKTDMSGVVNNVASYLSGFARDRGTALNKLIEMMKGKPNKELAKRGDFAMTYGQGSHELETAPTIVPFVPIKDIADEIKKKLSDDMEATTSPELKVPMQVVIKDASGHLSQGVALKSGVAGDRYAQNYIAHVDESLGKMPLVREADLGVTFDDAGHIIKTAGPLERDPEHEELGIKIKHEMSQGAGKKISPGVMGHMSTPIEMASHHVAKEKGAQAAALAQLMGIMKEKGETPLATLQGYDQTYDDAVERLKVAPSLTNDNVDKSGYDAVTRKLKDLAADKDKHNEPKMQDVIEDVSKYLAQPVPETVEDKRKLLAEFLKREGSSPLLAQDGLYKMTYKQGADEVMTGPVGKRTAEDPTSKEEVLKKMEKRLKSPTVQEMLRETTDEGAAHLADVVKGRGQAMEAIHGKLKDAGNVDLVDIGGVRKSHKEGADIISKAPHFEPHEAPPGAAEALTSTIKGLNVDPKGQLGKEHLAATQKIAGHYIAGETARESGYDPASKYGGGAAWTVKTGAGAPAGVGAGGPPGGVGASSSGKIGAGGPGGTGAGAPGGTGTGASGGTGTGASGRIGAGAPGGIGSGGPGGIGTGGLGGAGAVGLAGSPKVGSGAGSPGTKSPGAGSPGTKSPGTASPGAKGAGAGGPGAAGGVGGEPSSPSRPVSPKVPIDLSALGAAFGTGSGGGRGRGSGTGGPQGYETEAQRRKREEEEDRLRAEAEEALLAETDPERYNALQLLYKALLSRPSDNFHGSPPISLTNQQAHKWLKLRKRVDKSISNSPDTDRLSKKFEKKLADLVQPITPEDLRDVMQDVIIESSHKLAEYFVSANYKESVKTFVISEMQKKGNELLIENDNGAESYFYAAQRFKLTDSLETGEPCSKIAYELTKKLEDVMRARTMPRKYAGTVKEHVREGADYLSSHVTKPDSKIEAYVALLAEMETAGDKLLVEGEIPKSYKDSAAYLRELTSFQDKIGRSNSSLQSAVEGKLKNLMANVNSDAYSNSTMNSVISENTRLLVSYITLQAEKSKELQKIIKLLEAAGDGVLLRHGDIRKTYLDAADLLRGKNTDQLNVTNPDPVAARKIQIKLYCLMHGPLSCQIKKTPLLEEVVEDVTNFLAVHLLQPQIVKVCKCMKNVFVQCELWCEEILRRVARPCCTCSRHVSSQALEDLVPSDARIRFEPGTSAATVPGIHISVGPCPSGVMQPCSIPGTTPAPVCPGMKPEPGPCSHHPRITQSFLLHGMQQTSPFARQRQARQSRPTLPPFSRMPQIATTSSSPDRLETRFDNSIKEHFASSFERRLMPSPKNLTPVTSSTSFYTPNATTSSTRSSDSKKAFLWKNLSALFLGINKEEKKAHSKMRHMLIPDVENIQPEIKSEFNTSTTTIGSEATSSSAIVTTDQMSDWHAMMVSLMWNVQAWRDWLQDNIDRAIAATDVSPNDVADWREYFKKTSTEAIQWRQYNIFSHTLTVRLAQRYKDKQIVSPTRGTYRTQMYDDCQREMLNVIDMFNKWTRWLITILKETDAAILTTGVDNNANVNELRWKYYRNKVLELSEDWKKYNTHLKVCWEHKYRLVVSEWLPAWRQPGPVWVVSACGAVPSGAVRGGVQNGETVWVARTTHRRNVLPAALVPSQHCCLVYADGAIHHYTKYQVMCNADVKWVAWRATGGPSLAEDVSSARALRVAPGVHVGRVLYRGNYLIGPVTAPKQRCHVVIFGRPFAFNCYELLVLSPPEPNAERDQQPEWASPFRD